MHRSWYNPCSLLFLLLFPLFTAAQPLFRFMDWAGDDICLDAEKLTNGRIAALLESKDANGISDACVVFLNEQGDFQKRVCLRISGVQTAKTIRALPDSGYLIAGKTASNGGDCYLARFNSADSLLWIQTFGGSGDEEPQDIELTDNGQILLCGYTRSYGPAGFNSLLLKYDLAGTLLWSRVFSTNTFDAAYRLLTIGQTYYMSCNMNVSPVFGKGDQHLMKLDSSGNLIWTKAYGTGDNEHAWNMIRTLDGKIAFPMASTLGGTNKEIVFIKIDTSGNILLSSRLENGSEALDVFDLVQDPDSSFCLAGHTFTNSALIHSLIIRIDKNGTPLQSKRSNFSLSCEFWRLLHLGPYHYLFFGYGDKQGTAGSKLFVASSDSALNLSCLNWQHQPLTRTSSGIDVAGNSQFSSSNGGSGQSASMSFASDTVTPGFYDKNKNPSISTLLPASKYICKVDSLLLDPGNFQHYQWENGSVQRFLYADTFDTWRIRVYTMSGCFNDDSIKLIPVTPTPIVLSNDTCGRDSLKLRVNPLFGHQYSWDFSPGNYEGTVTREGWYYIEDYEPSGNCRIVDSIFVKLSPNALAISSDTLLPCLKDNLLKLSTQNSFQLSGDQLAKNTWWLDQVKIDSSVSLTFTASDIGWKNILVVSESKKGCTDSAYFRYHVHYQPRAEFILSDTQSCWNTLPVRLTDISVLESGSYKRSWFSNGINLNTGLDFFDYSPSASGLYMIDLVVVSDSGCRDTARNSLNIFPAPEVKIYTEFPEPQCLNGNAFTFVDSSSWKGGTGPYTSRWETEIPNMQIPQGITALVTFPDIGKGKIMLFLETPSGCVDSASYEVFILPDPHAQMTATDTLLCEGYGELQLVNTSSFPGNAQSTLFLPDGGVITPFGTYIYTFSDTGEYVYKLLVLSDNGCGDSLEQTIYVRAKPGFQLITNSLIPCLNENEVHLSFTDQRNSLTGLHMHYGDDSLDIQSPYFHHYNDPGNYRIMAIGENAHGCLDSQFLDIAIFPSPEALFEIEAQCLGEETVFFSSSRIDSGSIVHFRWTFGDGLGGEGNPTSHIYGAPGNYTVLLSVVSDKGCSDSLEVFEAAWVRDVVPAEFLIDTLKVGYDFDLLRFYGQNKNAVSHEWNFSDGASYFERIVNYEVRDSGSLVVHYLTRDSFSCVSERWDTLQLDFNRLLAIPNAFSPNSDGLNTLFKPVGAKFNNDYLFLIFNRWGEIIFETKDPEAGWDGTFRGEPCPVDIYVYQIRIDGGKYEYYGTIHLVR